MLAPFEQLPYRELPELPRVPHGFGETRGYDIRFDSKPFGEHRVHVRELGDGPPLLLVHGLMTTSYSFRYIVEPLARHFRVVAPDLPGAGRTDKVDAHCAPEALTQWLVEFVEELSLVGAACLGNSMGGYLCMRAVLLLYSRRDPMVPPGIGQRLRELIPSAELTWLEEGSHFAHIDRPELFLDEALPFLQRYGTRIAGVEGATPSSRTVERNVVESAHETLASLRRCVRLLPGLVPLQSRPQWRNSTPS